MRKSEHTELATLSRLAVLASTDGVAALTYGSASNAAHLSRGAIQRLFPDKSRLQCGVFLHASKLMHAHVFATARLPEERGNPVKDNQNISNVISRWADWISGDAGLPGGCVLLASVASRGLSAELTALIERSRATFFDQLSLAAIQGNLIFGADQLGFEQVQLGRALMLHIAQFPPVSRRVENKSAFIHAVTSNPLASNPIGIRPARSAHANLISR
jgi:hypothetical protein